MQKKLRFLKISSLIIKIVSGILFLIGLVGGFTVIVGGLPNYPAWIGIIIILVYGFVFLFLYTLALVVDILIEIKKEG